MGRNFLKGILGDAINPILAAAAFNFVKYARIEYARIQYSERAFTKYMRPPRKKFTGLPLWREDNSLFK
jgi:hypothetical protein